MRHTFLSLLLLFGSSITVFAQADAKDYSMDVQSIDKILSALYASISGEAGEARDWDRFQYLFAQGALLTPTRTQGDTISYEQWTPAEYAERAAGWFEARGFFEEELHREVHEYANIAQVFSTYTSRRTADGDIFARGINSIQLFHDGSRWYILSIFWAAETEKTPIPEVYLPKE